MSKKGKKHKREQKPERSEIIRQCVIYVQSVAAFKAGFKVDPSGDFDYAGCGKGQFGRTHFSHANHALQRLVALSPACLAGRQPLTPPELLAKAGVLSAMWAQEGGKTRSCEPIETVYVTLFAREVEDYMRAEAEPKD